MNLCLELAQLATETSPTNGLYRTILGAVLWRLGRHREAIQEFNRTLSQGSSRLLRTRLLLALARFEQDPTKQTKQALEAATNDVRRALVLPNGPWDWLANIAVMALQRRQTAQTSKLSWEDWVELRDLHRQAEALLKQRSDARK